MFQINFLLDVISHIMLLNNYISVSTIKIYSIDWNKKENNIELVIWMIWTKLYGFALIYGIKNIKPNLMPLFRDLYVGISLCMILYTYIGKLIIYPFYFHFFLFLRVQFTATTSSVATTTTTTTKLQNQPLE